jgi:hypothetical protein
MAGDGTRAVEIAAVGFGGFGSRNWVAAMRLFDTLLWTPFDTPRRHCFAASVPI